MVTNRSNSASILSPTGAHIKYRPDIDGLRAIAVLLVVTFHAYPNVIQGGFIGVDIFFVISGFLISTIIYSNLENNTFSFADFYALTSLNGKPKLIKACGSRTVYIYGKDQMRVRKFVNVGDTFTWKACDLPTVIGEQTAEYEMKKMDDTQSGYLTFGPYEQLTTGEYTFEIAYSSNATKEKSVGKWDVLLATPQITNALQDGFITGSDGLIEIIIGQFQLSQEQNMGKIEIRTMANKDTDLKIIYIRIKRIR